MITNDSIEHEQTAQVVNSPCAVVEKHENRGSFRCGSTCCGVTLIYTCLVANVISLIVCFILFISEMMLKSILGCSCGGCFMCFNNVILELVGICFAVNGIVASCILSLRMITTTAAWYIITAVLLFVSFSENLGSADEDGWLWIVLGTFSFALAGLHLALLLAFYKGIITRQNTVCSCNSCCYGCECEFTL